MKKKKNWEGKMRYTIKMHRTMGKKNTVGGEKDIVAWIRGDGVKSHQENATCTWAEFQTTSKNKDGIIISWYKYFIIIKCRPNSIFFLAGPRIYFLRATRTASRNTLLRSHTLKRKWVGTKKRQESKVHSWL